jgi:predicted RNA-binding protein YlxR (DUF448 family)
VPSRGHKPLRTCIACRQEGLKPELVRLVRSPDGRAVVDLAGRAPGRGAYLHRAEDCIETARKRRNLERALGATTGPELWLEIACV